MKLHNLLTEDMIILDLESRDRDSVLMEMVGYLKKKNRIVREKELLEKLIQREKLGSTAIGEGFAIPHCKAKDVKNPLVLLAISRKGVDFSSLDGKPSSIFFLVVSSPDNPSVNLQILAVIAHLVRKSNTLIKKVLGAKTRKAMLDFIRQEEDKLDG